MATLDQQPSPWAFHFTVTDTQGTTQNLFWDYVQDPFFAWDKGVFLVWTRDDGINERIVGVDQYPASQSAPFTPEEKLVRDCRERFNAKIADLFKNEEHPVDDAIYEYLLANLIWNPSTQLFE